MNAKLATKLNLLNYIRNFSMPDYPDLGILSNTFFYDLFLSSCKNVDNYALLYGDIDGLRKLNDKIGFNNANIAIEELLKSILNYLPKNVTSAKLGGDEFCFILPGLSTKDTRVLTKQIHESLSSNEKVHGLDITFGACDSSEFDNIHDMYAYVENKVNLKKHFLLDINENVKDINEYNRKLDIFINSTISSYIKNFRFSSKRVFNQDDLKTLSYPVINTITHLLDTDDIVLNNTDEKFIHGDNDKIAPDVASKVYNLITNKEIDYDELDSISIPDLNNIRDILSTDSITGAHNNVYRDHYILPRFAEEEAPFKVILAESLGIKILNSISSHSSTDLKIKSTFDSLINNLNEVIPKESNIRTFPIHSGGGTFEIIVKNDYNNILTPEKVNEILNKVNSNPNNIALFGAIENCPSTLDYDHIYSDLNRICEEKKSEIKDTTDYFISPDALKLLDVSLSSAVNYFKVQAKHLGIYNDDSKIQFSKKIINSLIDNFYQLNLQNADKNNEPLEEFDGEEL